MRLGRDFTHEFTWQGKRLRVGFLLPAARTKIAAGLELMSNQTIRHRFFGIKNGFTERELKYLTEIDGIHHFALGVEEVDDSERGIAVVRMVRDDLRRNEAEIAVLIVDEYQRQGLGRLLINLCALAAAERGIDVFRFTFQPDNQGIRRLINSYGRAEQDQMGPDYIQQRISISPERTAKIREELEDFLK